MKILSPAQIRALDVYTIQNEPISSIALMERAANAFVKWFVPQFPNAEETPICIFCGPGNNGGDGLAIARLLNQKFYSARVFCCKIGNKTSEDFGKNLKRIPRRRGLPIVELKEGDAFPRLAENIVLIDAIFGSGLSRPIEGYWADLVQYLNRLSNLKVAVDIPSGLFANRVTVSPSIRANYTLSFELPKLAFLFPENQDRVGECYIQPIGLDQSFIQKADSSFRLIDEDLIRAILKKRKKFDHKGTFGHALLIMGSYGKIGAAILAAKACLRSGAGLVTVHIPKCGYEILQIGFPEAMASVDRHQFYISEIPDLKLYKAIGLGCGLDQKVSTKEAIFELLKKSHLPLVLDADALNLLAQNPEYLKYLPTNSLLTPHPKEFERLFGKTSNDFARNDLQRKKAKELNCYLLLKGANTAIACPDGTCYFNSTGNPGMATGGSGDVLTGLLTGLLAQGYTPKAAALLGVYLHGLSGDIAAETLGHESLLASDLVKNLGRAFQKVSSSRHFP